MLPVQHSHIRRSSDLQDSSHSDIQELNHLRDLLPSHQPISAVDNYLIEFNQEGSISQFGEESVEYSEMMVKISEQTHKILKMQEELYYFKSQFFKIAKENQNHLETVKQAEQLQAKMLALVKEQQKKLGECQNKLLEEKNKRRQEQAVVQQKQKQMEQLRKEIVYLKQSKAESNLALVDKLNEELRFHEQVILQLSLKNQKIMKINLYLKEELRITENKLIQLEIELQEKSFGQLSKNLVRLKENHNLINKKPPYNQQQIPPERQHSSHLRFKFNSEGEKDTIKLTSRRDSTKMEDIYHREVKTLEKERAGFSPHLIDKLKPLEDPKPHRKLHRAVDIQPPKKLRHNLSPPELYS